MVIGASVRKFCATAFSVLAVCSAVNAQEAVPTIVIHGDLCPATKQGLVNWAQDMPVNAAYAAPLAPPELGLSCDTPGPMVDGGQAWGAETVDLARERALAVCESVRPAQYTGCAVIATIELRPRAQ